MSEPTQETTKQPTENHPQDVAATMFSMYHPRFELIVDTLSNNELRRVLKNVVLFPLADPPIKHISTQENEAFQLGVKLAQANQMMQLWTYSEAAAQLEREATEKNNEALASEMVETNG